MGREVIEELTGQKFSGLGHFQEGVLVIFFDSFEMIYKNNLRNLKKKDNLDQTSRLGLVLNGENNTMWSIRHQLLEEGYFSLERLEEELKFLNLISLRFKKSSQAFHYRLRVVTLLLEREEVLPRELEFLEHFFQIHSRNYHGWTYLTKLLKIFLPRDTITWFPAFQDFS